MSALLTPRRAERGRRAKPRGEGDQASLFAAATGAAATPSTTASARRQGPTLDDLVAGAWEGLLAGAPADCLACGAPITPRQSAGAGIVGGRCGGCGTTLA